MAQVLAIDQDGNRLMPLVASGCSKEARTALSGATAPGWFPNSRAPEAALGGLWLYFSGADECHTLVQDLETKEGCFWHAILHRQEPDAGNAAYWFRQVGSHSVFSELARTVQSVVAVHPNVAFRAGDRWDPFAFIDFCEEARRKPASPSEQLALEIQRAEWQLLFDYCARAGS